MGIVKEYRFPVSVRLVEGRRTLAVAPEKEPLEVATPPEFHGGVRGVWSPEDLLVAAAASCLTVTLAAVAERMEVPVRDVVVTGTGHVGRRTDGRFGFVAVELELTLETDEEHVGAAENAAERAKELCMVTAALDVPVHVAFAVRTPAAIAV